MKLSIAVCIFLVFLLNICNILVAVKMKKEEKKSFLYRSLAGALTFAFAEMFLKFLSFHNLLKTIFLYIPYIIFSLTAYSMLVICITDLAAFIVLSLVKEKQ